MEVGPAPCVDGMNVPLDKVTMPTIKHCTTSYLELRLGSQMRYENGFFPFECVITLQNRQKCFINQRKCHKKCTGFKKKIMTCHYVRVGEKHSKPVDLLLMAAKTSHCSLAELNLYSPSILFALPPRTAHHQFNVKPLDVFISCEHFLHFF